MPESTDDKRGNTDSAVPARIEQRAGEPTLKQSGRTRDVRVSPGRIGRWSARHPWRALAIWLGFVTACIALGAATVTASSCRLVASQHIERPGEFPVPSCAWELPRAVPAAPPPA